MAMKDGQVGVRQMAAEALSHFGPAAAPAVPLLIDALKDRERRLRQDALNALGKIGAGAAAAVPALVEILRDKDQEDRAQALLTLLMIGPAARASLPAIREMFTAKDKKFRTLAAATAWRVGNDTKGRELLLEALRGKDATMRESAVALLGEVGPAAKDTIPQLRTLLRDPDSLIRFYAAHSLWRIAKDEAAIPILIDLLQDKNTRVRRWSATELGDIGPAAKKAVSALEQACRDDDDEYVQRFAAEALQKIVPDKPKP
jgi:HEAT repeat protein